MSSSERARMAGRSADPRPRSVRHEVLGGLLTLLVVLCFVLHSAGRALEVQMAGESQTVFLNETANISCRVSSPRPLDLKIMGFVWYRKRRNKEVKLLEIYGDPPKTSFPSRAFISLENLRRGDASLQLPGVQLDDAGEYRCEVVLTPVKAQGSILLNVIAQPHCTLIPEKALVKVHGNITANCTASSFFPQNITMRWKRKTQKDPQIRDISENALFGPLVRNKDHTYSVSSILTLKPSLQEHLAMYQCEIEHPASGTFYLNLTLMEQESNNATTLILMSKILCIFIGLVPLCCLFCKRLKDLCTNIPRTSREKKMDI